MTTLRITRATALVLQALAAGHRHGFDIVETTGVPGGTVYPVLRRLEERGLVESRWEEPEVGRGEGRPSRKYYRLLAAADDVLRAARARHPLDLVADLRAGGMGAGEGPAGRPAGAGGGSVG